MIKIDFSNYTDAIYHDAFDYLDNGARPAEDGAAFDLRVSDDYGLRHEFKTGPMFGCVKFQARGEK